LSSQEEKVNWRLTIRAALVLAAVGLGFSGVFHYGRIGCPACWQEIARHYFAFFGYIAAFGFAIGWTLPDRRSESQGSAVQWSTRQGFWEGSLGAGALLTIAWAATHLLA
jgi:hypothetical protein